MSKESDAAMSCVAGVLTLCIQLPLFFLLLYGVLASVNAPTWIWVIYWSYLPVCFALGLFRTVVEAAAKANG